MTRPLELRATDNQWHRRVRDLPWAVRALRISLSILLLALAAPAVLAQSTGAATLRGTVKDPDGAIIPDAAVTLTSQKSGRSRTSKSSSEGVYVFAQIDPDTYTLTVEAPNFKKYIQTDLAVSPNDTRGQDVTLTVGGSTETVTVTTQEEIVTETGEVAHTITASQIQNFSLLSRSSLELLRILPGVAAPDGTQLQTTSFGGGANANNQYNVNGLRGEANSVSLDGSHLQDIGSNNGTIVTPNNDFVQEVKVQVSNYAAEYGNSAVQISAVTKGGGKDFHGSLYEYSRPRWAAANDRSLTSADSTAERPKTRFNYPGGTIGGPVLIPGTDFNKDRDKLFFFLGIEVQRQLTSADTRYGVTPTLLQRQGNFSEFLGGNYLQQGAAKIPGGFPNAGQVAPGGDLSPYIDPIGQALINLYPLPTGNYANGLYNYATNAQANINRVDWKMRFDYKLTERTNMFVRWARETESNDYPYGIWWQASNYELPTPVLGTNLGRSLVASVTTVISPETVNEFVFSGSRLLLDNDYKDPEKVTKDALGLNGFTYPFGSQTQYAPLNIIASWNGPGPGDFWSPGPLPLFAHNDSYSVTDNLSKLVGSHNLKFGGFVEQANKTQNFQNNADGEIILATWANGSTGNIFGDLLADRPAQLNHDTPPPIGHFRLYNYEGYAQDSWKIKPNFTMEYGVRVSYFPNNYERDNLGAVFDPNAYIRGAGAYVGGDPTKPNGILTAASGAVDKGLIDNPPVKFAPRVGFAWDIRGNATTVVRGGAGVFYNRVQGNYQYGVIKLPPNAYSFAANSYSYSNLGYSTFGDINPFASLSGPSPESQDIAGAQIPRSLTLSLSVAQRLPFDTVIEASYVGTQGRHLPQRVSINGIQPGQVTGVRNGVDLTNPINRAALDASVVNQFRDYPDFGDITYDQFTGTSSYHSLQVQISRQQAQNLQYYITYTYSKALGTQATNETGSLIDPIDTRGRAYGLLPYDRTHIFNASYIWSLPKGAYGALDNPFGRGALNGWKVSGITTVQSGTPIFIGIGGDYNSNNTRLGYFGTPSSTLGVFYNADPRTGTTTTIGGHILNGSAFSLPGFGDLGAYQSPFNLRSPTRSNTDITLFKTFGITESQNLEFRVGLFNIFNQAFPNVGLGDIITQLQTTCNRRVDNVPNGIGGTANGVCDPTGGYHITNSDAFGTIVNKHGHRIVEFALKYNF